MCETTRMPMNLNIDDTLLNQALQEYVQRRHRLELVKLGKVDFGPDWDYKRDRRAR
jgi:hypothetical protein